MPEDPPCETTLVGTVESGRLSPQLVEYLDGAEDVKPWDLLRWIADESGEWIDPPEELSILELPWDSSETCDEPHCPFKKGKCPRVLLSKVLPEGYECPKPDPGQSTDAVHPHVDEWPAVPLGCVNAANDLDHIRVFATPAGFEWTKWSCITPPPRLIVTARLSTGEKETFTVTAWRYLVSYLAWVAPRSIRLKNTSGLRPQTSDIPLSYERNDAGEITKVMFGEIRMVEVIGGDWYVFRGGAQYDITRKIHHWAKAGDEATSLVGDKYEYFRESLVLRPGERYQYPVFRRPLIVKAARFGDDIACDSATDDNSCDSASRVFTLFECAQHDDKCLVQGNHRGDHLAWTEDHCGAGTSCGGMVNTRLVVTPEAGRVARFLDEMYRRSDGWDPEWFLQVTLDADGKPIDPPAWLEDDIFTYIQGPPSPRDDTVADDTFTVFVCELHDDACLVQGDHLDNRPAWTKDHCRTTSCGGVKSVWLVTSEEGCVAKVLGKMTKHHPVDWDPECFLQATYSANGKPIDSPAWLEKAIIAYTKGSALPHDDKSTA